MEVGNVKCMPEVLWPRTKWSRGVPDARVGAGAPLFEGEWQEFQRKRLQIEVSELLGLELPRLGNSNALSAIVSRP
jgi:hypothetical protein